MFTSIRNLLRIRPNVKSNREINISVEQLLGNYEDRRFQYSLRFEALQHASYLKSYLDINRKFIIFSCFDSLALRNRRQLNVVEIGVCYGGNLEYMKHLSDFLFLDTKLFAFDTFEGHPHVNRTYDNISKHHVGKFFLKYRSNTLETLEQLGVEVHIGDIIKTLETVTFENGIDFMHLDTDLFDSTKFVLERLPNLLNIGGICLLDDFKCETTPGIIAAFNSVELGSKFTCLETPFNQVMIIRLN